MTTWLMLYALGVASILAPAAVMSDRAMALGGRPRRWVWAVSLLLAVGLPALSPWRPPADDQVGSAVVAGATRGVARIVGDDPEGGLARGEALLALAEPWAMPLWLTSSAGAAAMLLLGGASLARQRRRWSERMVGNEAVLVSERTGPAVVGLLHPRVVFPVWVFRLDPSSLDVVLRHEREHITARDVWTVHGAALAVVIMPWNPVVWWMAARVRLAVELDCDARVLAGGARDTSAITRYGETLLAVASRKASGYSAMMPAMIESPSLLARRIDAMWDRDIRFRRVRRIAATLGAVTLLLAACRAPTPGGSRETGLDGSQPLEPTLPPVAGEVTPEARPERSSTEGRTEDAASGLDREMAPTDGDGSTEEANSATPGQSAQSAVRRLGPGVANPSVLRSVRPTYTPGAMRRKVQGVVQLEVIVNPEGRVAEVEVLRSLDPDLDAEAVKAARQWEFRPATVDGKPVSIAVMLELQFSIH